LKCDYPATGEFVALSNFRCRRSDWWELWRKPSEDVANVNQSCSGPSPLVIVSCGARLVHGAIKILGENWEKFLRKRIW
jgi:hypothetical protein